MPARTVKVAISLPAKTYREVEKTRKRLRVSRSALISEALRCWIASGNQRAKLRAYVEGYKKFPETSQEQKLFGELAAPGLTCGEWSNETR